MLISIVIPTYNRNDLLEQCLECLKISLQGIERSLYEVIVTDDSKQGMAKELINGRFDFVTWVQGPQKGPAANRNYGASVAKGEWLLFTDDDCLPQKGWFTAYLAAISTAEEPILEGKTIADKPQERYDEVAPLNLTGNRLWSCNFAIKRQLFTDANGFDEHFPHSTMEDIDFQERILKVAGVRFIPEALVVHPWRRRVAFRHFFLRLKSQKYFAVKHKLSRTLSYRITRLKVFVAGIFVNFGTLAKFSMRGWQAYFDKVCFDFFRVFI